MTKILKGKIAFSNDLYNHILMYNESKERVFTYHHINILSFLMWKSTNEGGLNCSNISLKEINEFLNSKDRRYNIAKKVLEDLHKANIIILPTDKLGLFVEFPKPSNKMAITLTEGTHSNSSIKGFTYIPKALIKTCPKSISIYLAIGTKHSENYNKLSYTILMERSLITGRREFDRFLNDLIDNEFIYKQSCKGAKKEANRYKINENYTRKSIKRLPVKKTISAKKIIQKQRQEQTELLEEAW